MANDLALTDPAFGPGRFGQALTGGVGVGASGVAALPWTMEAFVRLPGNPGAVQVALGTGNCWLGIDAAGRPQAQVAGPNTLAGPTPIADGAWHHLRLAATAAGTKLLVDGALAASSPTPASAVPSGGIGVRRYGTTPGYDWSGAVDEVAIWPSDRSADPVPGAPYTGAEGMAVLWRLDGGGADGAGAAPATGYALTGPASGTVGAASAPFAVAANGTLAAPVTVTPGDGGAGGTFAPARLTLPAGAGAAAGFTYTPATTGPRAIATSNDVGLADPAALAYAAAPWPLAAVLFSPLNWSVSAAGARSLNAGAYFRAGFTGGHVALTFDVSALAGPPPQICYAVDGGPVRLAALSARVPLVVPTDTASYPVHALEVAIKSTTATVPRWPGAATTVALTGIALDDGAALVAPVARARTILVLGDSITEGVAARDGGADTDRDDATLGYAYLLGRELGAEVGVVGLSGQGLTCAGDAGVPALPATYGLVLPGVARAFAPEPDLIVINQGTNDAVKTGETAAVTTALAPVLAALLAALLAATRGARVVVLGNFGGYLIPQLRAAVARVNDPRCSFLDTAGLVGPGDLADAYHPRGAASLLKIAPALAARLRPLLDPPAPGPAFRRGFH